ncbi:MAG: TolC family protein, partial [Myxococcota bacterium]
MCRWAAAAFAALALAGCATTDPTATVAATGESLAARGVAGVEWRRTEAERSGALERSRALLAKPLTLDAAAEVALLRSPTLQATLAALGVAQAELAQATRLANPGLSFERLSGDDDSVRATGLVADVVDWLTQPLRRRLAAAELERVKLEVGAALLDGVAAAKLAFVTHQAAEELVARLAR